MIRFWCRRKTVDYPTQNLLPGARFIWNGQLFQVKEVYRPYRLDGTYDLVVRSAPVDGGGGV